MEVLRVFFILLLTIFLLQFIRTSHGETSSNSLSKLLTCRPQCEGGLICDRELFICVTCQVYCTGLFDHDCTDVCPDYAKAHIEPDKTTGVAKQPTVPPTGTESLYNNYVLVVTILLVFFILILLLLAIFVMVWICKNRKQQSKPCTRLSTRPEGVETLPSERPARERLSYSCIGLQEASDNSLDCSELAIHTPFSLRRPPQIIHTTPIRLSATSLCAKTYGRKNIVTAVTVEHASEASSLLDESQYANEAVQAEDFEHTAIDLDISNDAANQTEARITSMVSFGTRMQRNDAIVRKEQVTSEKPSILHLDSCHIEDPPPERSLKTYASGLSVSYSGSLLRATASLAQPNSDLKSTSYVSPIKANLTANSEKNHRGFSIEHSNVSWKSSAPSLRIIEVNRVFVDQQSVSLKRTKSYSTHSKDLRYTCSKSGSNVSKPCTNDTDYGKETEVKAISTNINEPSILPYHFNSEQVRSSHRSGPTISNSVSGTGLPQECFAERDAEYKLNEETAVKPRYEPSESGYGTTSSVSNAINSNTSRHDSQILSHAPVNYNSNNEQCNVACIPSDGEEEGMLLPIPSSEQCQNGLSNDNEPSLRGGFFYQIMAVNNVTSNRPARIQSQPINNVNNALERQHYHSSNMDVHAHERDNLLQDDAQVNDHSAVAANHHYNDHNGNASRDEDGQLEGAVGGLIGSVEDEYDGGIVEEAMPLAGLGEVSFIGRSIIDDSGARTIYNPEFQDRSGFHIQHHNNNPVYEQLQNMPWVLGYHTQGRSISVYADLDQHDEHDLHQRFVDVTHQPWDKFRVKANH